jgi:serine/threonine protein kinase
MILSFLIDFRDIKPLNIMIHKYFTEPWIFDFGIARKMPLQNHGPVTDVGTVGFKAPEYPGYCGRYTDIFALGATALQLTGRLADDDVSWDTVLAKCPWTNDLKSVVGQMIAGDHTKRYQNCQDVISALKATQQPDPVQTPVQAPPPPSPQADQVPLTKPIRVQSRSSTPPPYETHFDFKVDF